MVDNKEIIITIAGGAIQDVENIPNGYKIIIKDYDVEGFEIAKFDMRLSLY